MDLRASGCDYQDREGISVGKYRIMPLAAIYGANASGKSNLYYAFEYMSEYVINSFGYGDETKNYKKHAPPTFLFDSETADTESSFEVFFSASDNNAEVVYSYGFCVNKQGVTAEWLSKRNSDCEESSMIFYRGGEDNELDLSGLPDDSRQNITVALEPQVLIVSLGAKLRIAECKAIRDWFLANEFTDFGNPFSNFVLSHRLPEGFTDNKAIQQDVIRFFSAFDNQIQDFKIEEVAGEGDTKEKSYRISALHKVKGSDKMAELPLADESAGTLKMFALYPELKSVIDKGGVFFIDELNARLHPLLVRCFLQVFLNPEVNVNHAQLIFTTHDAWQLYDRMLKKDEIWFIQKDSEGKSELYSLADFPETDSASYGEDYLHGKFGAIPDLSSIIQARKTSEI
ncbi:ATP/GTP-binding protein [Succinimonas sp.]|uniref:AAA family ATPase n=1 Tax=Succinimonas sp. TaxID=1936151 RepID=UPI0038680D14